MDPALVTARYADHINPAFVRLLGTFGYGRIYTRARGMELWDDQGRRYLDFLAGFGTVAFGHNPPQLLERITAALGDETPNLVHVGPQAWAAELGHALARRVPSLPLCLLSCTGGEAVEAAMKLARAATGRPGIVYCGGGFHGTGLGNLSVIGHARWQRPFQPLLPECYAVPFGDLEALKTTLARHKIAGFLVEPIQGEAGVVMPPEGYLREAQRLCQERGALFMLDEVQTGLRRTGDWFAHQSLGDGGLDPDVLILGKALGAGIIPISATLTRRELQKRAYGEVWKFDLHGSTYSGNALACRCALAVLEGIEELDVRETGEYFMRTLRDRLAGHPLVKEVRGRGLLVGLELGKRLFPSFVLAQWLSVRLLESGFICQPASQQWNVLKLTPPLVVDRTHIDDLVSAIGTILDEYRSLAPLAADVTKRLGSQFLGGGQFL